MEKQNLQTLREELKMWLQKVKSLRPLILRRTLNDENLKERQLARLEAAQRRRKLYYEKNRPKQLAYQHEYYMQHAELKKSYAINYYTPNKERIIAKAQADARKRTEKLIRTSIDKLKAKFEKAIQEHLKAC